MSDESQAPISLATPVRLLRQMNHDLRNPINSALATAMMLSEGICDPLTPKQTRAIQRIERNVARVVTLLDDLMGYVKASAGELLPAPRNFNPIQILDGIQTQCRPVAEAKNLALAVENTPAVPALLHGDDSLIQRIVLALVWNAISFTSEGKVQVTSHWENGWLISVSDTGPGISE